jgi:undecaprenyl-diphosphatase
MIQSIDNIIYKLINQGYNAEWLDFIMIKFSDKYFWIPIYAFLFIVIVFVFKKKSIIILLCLGLAVVASDRLTSGFIKPLIKRERPCHIAALSPRVIDPCHDTGSMPSSHSANHFAISIFIILLFSKKPKYIKYSLFIWALLVAYSRVYCGVHYPSDVLVGGLIGSLLGFVFFNLNKLIERKLKWA